MHTQNLIKQTLSAPANIATVCRLLQSNTLGHRSELAARVCERFGFYDPRGRAQRGGCLKALRELEAAGHFTFAGASYPPRATISAAIIAAGGVARRRALGGR